MGSLVYHKPMLEELRQRISPEVKENVPLAPMTTFKIGGPAEFYFQASSANDGVKAIVAAKELGIPYTIIGGGSNMVVNDAGVKGLVVRLVTQNVMIDGTKVTAEAGAATGVVAIKAVGAGLTGIEWAVGIPGSIGGAVRGNAGSFGGEMKDVVSSVKVAVDGEVKEMTRDECKFNYRNSVFKLEPGILVLEVCMNLDWASDKEASKKKVQEIMAARTQKQPYDCPTAGCVFTNWKPANDEDLEALRKDLDLNKEEEIPRTAHGAVPAGWIIDRAQLKGFSLGHATISDKHANFVVTDGEAKADDVLALIAAVKSKIRNMTHGRVSLIEEIEYVGF